MSHTVRIELLNKDNYDSWSMQVEALMVKNDTWKYASGEYPIPTTATNNDLLALAIQGWKKGDREAKSDLILAISPVELQQVRGCATAREVWIKLQNVYASQGPAKKANLLKKLVTQRLTEENDVREHLNLFFDAVDKLAVMGVDINQELLSILLLYSLPQSYENFRCAIESRDELPTPEALKIKILEEGDVRHQKLQTEENGAMIAWKKQRNKGKERGSSKRQEKPKKSNPENDIQCFKCKKTGHIAKECPTKNRKVKTNQDSESYYACDSKNSSAFKISVDNTNNRWCLDSGSTSHVCRDNNSFVDFEKVKQQKIYVWPAMPQQK